MTRKGKDINLSQWKLFCACVLRIQQEEEPDIELGAMNQSNETEWGPAWDLWWDGHSAGFHAGQLRAGTNSERWG